MVVDINGQRIKYYDSWDSTTTKQYQGIVGWEPEKELIDRDYFKLFKVLYGDYKSFAKDNEPKLWELVRWVIDLPFPKLEAPKLLKIRGKYVSIPEDIKLLSIGQNIHARQEIDKAIILRNKETGKFIDCDCYSIVVAIFLQPLVDGGEFDFNKAKELEKEIAEMPITSIRPIGFFLLTDVLKYGTRPEKTWLQILLNQGKKLKRMLPSWQRFRGLSHSMT